MIIDVTYGGNYPWSLLLYSDTKAGSYSKFRPFFYAIVERGMESIFEEEVTTIFRASIEKIIQNYKRRGKNDIVELLQSYMDEYPKLVETSYTAYVWDGKLMRYVRSRNHVVYRVEVLSPIQVRDIARALISRGFRCSAFNIPYPCRFTMSNPWANALGIVYMYYDLDRNILEKLGKLKFKVYDIEILEDGTRLISFYETDPVSEEDPHEIMRNVTTIVDKDGSTREIVEDEFTSSMLMVGFNNMGFDDVKLVETGLLDQRTLKARPRIDLAIYIRNNASSLGIGTASFSLAMILLSLKKELKIPDEFIEMKLRSARLLKSIDTAERYNKADVVMTSLLAKPILQIVYSVSGLVGLAPSSYAHRLRSGQVFEFAFIRFLETVGEVIEARMFTETGHVEGTTFSGTKVFTLKDVTMWVRAYSEEVEKLRLMIEKGEDINKIVKYLRQLGTRILRMVKEMERSGKLSGEVIDKLYSGKIVWVDVEMMYPSEIVVEGIDPCCYINGLEEEAVFDPHSLPSPYHTLVQLLREWRGWAKKMKKKYETEGDKVRATCFDLLQKALKPIINASFGASTKKSGYTHGAHFQVGTKIFQNTRRKLISMMLYAYTRGWKPLYGDTDSLMLLIPENEDPNKVVEELNRIAGQLGYTLSLEGVMDYIYVRCKKSYVIGKRGETCKVKGQPLGKLKHAFSPLVISLILEALKSWDFNKLREEIEKIDDPYLLVPSLARKVTDMFLLDVESLKRRQIDTTCRIKVKIQDITGILKELKYDFVTRARLASLALSYGKKVGEDLYIVPIYRLSPHDILDLRALPILRLEEASGERRYKLTSDRYIVLRPDGKLLLAEVDPHSTTYILERTGRELKQRNTHNNLIAKYLNSVGIEKLVKLVEEGKLDAVPAGRYTTVLKRSGIKITSTYRLIGVLTRVNIVREATIEEVRRIVWENIQKWLRWSGLDKIVKVGNIAQTIQIV